MSFIIGFDSVDYSIQNTIDNFLTESFTTNDITSNYKLSKISDLYNMTDALDDNLKQFYNTRNIESPLDIAGLDVCMWIDPSNENLINLSAGTNIIVNNNNNIAIFDKSKYGNNYSVILNGTGLTYDYNKKMIKHEGGLINSAFVKTGLISKNLNQFITDDSPFSYFCVIEQSENTDFSTNNLRGIFSMGTHGIDNRPNFIVFNNNTQGCGWGSGDVNGIYQNTTIAHPYIYNSNAYPFVNGKRVILGWVYGVVNGQPYKDLYYNGIFCSRSINITGTGYRNDTINFGSYDTVGSYFEGWSGEQIIISRDLTRSEVIKLCDYLNNKWNCYPVRNCDVFVCAGQSNMVGRGNPAAGPAFTDIQVRGTEYGYYCDPQIYFTNSESPIACHHGVDGGEIKFFKTDNDTTTADSVLVAADSSNNNATKTDCLAELGNEYYKKTGRYAVFCKAAVGGTSLLDPDDWLPSNYKNNLWLNVMNIKSKISEKLKNNGWSVISYNLIWHQGESDADSNQVQYLNALNEAFEMVINKFKYDRVFYYIVAAAGDSRNAQLEYTPTNTHIYSLFDTNIFISTRLNFLNNNDPSHYNTLGQEMMGIEGGSMIGDIINKNSNINIKNININEKIENSNNIIFNGDGTVNEPSYTFKSDTDTGLYRSGVNEIGLTTGGVEKVKFNDTTIFNDTNNNTITNADLNQIFTLTGRQTWAGLTSTSILRRVIWAGGNINLFIAIHFNATAGGNQARILTSPDGITWTTRTQTQTGLTSDLNDIAYGNNAVVIVGSEASNVNTTFYSLNGTTYTAVTENPDIVNQGVIYQDNKFVSFGNDGRYAISADAVNWVRYRVTIVGVPSTLSIRHMTFDGVNWIAVTSSSNILKTNNITDQTSWVQSSITGLLSSDAIVYSQPLNRLVLSSSNTGNDLGFYSDDNGTNWYSFNFDDGNGNYSDIIWIDDFGGLFISSNSTGITNGRLIYSKDGFTWYKTTSTISSRIFSVCYNSTSKVLITSGTYDASLTWAITSSNLPNYIKPRNYIQINNDTKFQNSIEYKPNVTNSQIINVEDIDAPVLDCDTSNNDVDIRVRSSSFNGRVGYTVKIRKSKSSSNNVRLIGDIQNTRILTPLGEVLSFDYQSNPIVLIPPTYFGAFELVRVDDSGVGGSWYVNHMIYDASGVERKLKDLSVADICSATRFRAGNGVISNPSFSFTTETAQDCGMYYNNSGVDELRFAVDGGLSMTLQKAGGTSYTNTKLLINNGTTTNPGLTFNSTAVNTGFSGDSSNNLYTLTAGSINTTHTNNSFEVGRTISNNLAMKTLNVNGQSNFNTFTPIYMNIINSQITAGRTDGNWFGIDYNPTAGVYIIGSNGSGSGVTRIAVSASNNLTTWTTYTDTTLSPGSTALGNIRHVAYGPTPNIWIVGSGSSTTGNFYYSTDTINWTNVGVVAPFASARAYNRLKWINGQFVGLTGGSVLVFSSNGTTWTSRMINATSYTLQDIVYSNELRMYVITTTSAAVLYFNDTAGTGITSTTTFTAQTSNVYASNAIAWSPKLSMFIIQSIGSATQWASSTDGINWRVYTTTALNAVNNRIEWVPDFGGLFVGCQAATTNNIIVSRDGITWTQIALTLSGQSRGFYYNTTQKVFVFGLDANLTFKNALTDFNNYIDREDIYNTFNSNLRFADTIEYQPQNITCIIGNNHFTPSQFNRSVVNFDTTSTNANIYLTGYSFNGKVGMRYRIRKEASTLNNVRIHGYETCRILTPFGEVASFNSQSTPLTYSIIPAGYFGSFELTRVNDTSNGLWVIDNVNIYDSNGIEYKLKDLSIAGLLTTERIKYSVNNTTGDLTINPLTAKTYNFYNLAGAGNTRTITFSSITSLNIDEYNGFTIYLQRERFNTNTGGTVSFVNNSGNQMVYLEIDGATDNSEIINDEASKSTNSMLSYISFFRCYLVKNPTSNILNWYVREIGE